MVYYLADGERDGTDGERDRDGHTPVSGMVTPGRHSQHPDDREDVRNGSDESDGRCR